MSADYPLSGKLAELEADLAEAARHVRERERAAKHDVNGELLAGLWSKRYARPSTEELRRETARIAEQVQKRALALRLDPLPGDRAICARRAALQRAAGAPLTLAPAVGGVHRPRKGIRLRDEWQHRDFERRRALAGP